MFLVAGLWPAILIGFNLKPVIALVQQLRQFHAQLNFEGSYDRFRERAGANFAHIQEVRLATEMVTDLERDGSAFDQIIRRNPGNGLFSYLRAGRILADRSEASAEARFKIISADLEAAKNVGTCNWYTTEATTAWRSALRESVPRDDLNARISRDWASQGQAPALRTVCGRLLDLAEERWLAGSADEALRCTQATIDFARRTLDQTGALAVVIECAQQVESAAILESMVHASKAAHARAIHSRRQAEQAGRFHRTLRSRLETAAINPLLNTAVPREQPLQEMVSYMLVSGVLAVAWGATGVVVLALLICAALGKVAHAAPAPMEPARIGEGLLSWLGMGIACSAPSLIIVAGLLLVPFDPARVVSQNWIQPALVLSAFLTGAILLFLGRQRASATSGPPPTQRVWRGWWALLLIAGWLVLLRPWNPYGSDLAAFDQGWRTPQAIVRLYGLQGLVLLLAVPATLIWLVWVLSRLRNRKKGDAPQPRHNGGYLRTTAVLGLWSWLFLGMMTWGAIRLYHRYDSRLAELTTRDLQDEVAGWMGPAWKKRFFDWQP